MSYVEKNLLPGETILCTGRLHWIIYLKPMLLMAVGLVVVVLPLLVAGVPNKLWIWGLAATWSACWRQFRPCCGPGPPSWW